MTALTLPVHDEPMTLEERWTLGICICDRETRCAFHYYRPGDPTPRPLAPDG